MLVVIALYLAYSFLALAHLKFMEPLFPLNLAKKYFNGHKYNSPPLLFVIRFNKWYQNKVSRFKDHLERIDVTCIC